jgi:uncharacterized membrane protein YfcA
MDIYLPIANMSVNALVLILLGGGVGILSGMFGVGGGFLTTPLLILYGIPPTIAAASATTQVTGASVSGVLAHWQRDGVDFRMGALLVLGGLFGSVAGAGVFSVLEKAGQMDTIIAILYVVLLTSVGGLMARDAWAAISAKRAGLKMAARKRRHHPLVATLPMRWRFYASGIYISPLAPAALGFLVGMLTVLLGVGGGFILVPAMIYILGMATRVVVGTSLFQILFVTAITTLVHALTTHAVDIVLAGLLLIGSVIGAQFGTSLAAKLPPDWLRLGLSILILSLAIWLALGLGWRPPELYSVHPL